MMHYNADYVSDYGYIKVKKIFLILIYKDYFKDKDNAILMRLKII